MYRHSPSRNQRSKGFRLKHVLQICVLVAVCFWLIYQVKHSHDKRKQFDESNAKSSLDMEKNNVVVKFGRKDLIPLEKATSKDPEIHDGEAEDDDNEEGNIEQDKREEESREEETEEEDKHEEEKESEENDKHEEATEKEDGHEDETGEEDMHEDETREEDKHEEEAREKDKSEEQNRAEDKHEEEEQEEDIQADEKDDEGRGDGDGDDVVNEQKQEKADTDVDGEEESIDEEKEKEDPIKEETEEKNDEDKDTLTKNDPSIEGHVHEEGSRNTREAREEQYKGDDASSAVTHDAQTTSTEIENASSGSQLNILEHENKGNSTEEYKNATVVHLPEVETAGNGTSALDEIKKPVAYDSVSQSNSSLASITGLESNDQQGSTNNADNSGSSIRNETEIISDPSLAHNATEGDTTTTDGSNIQTIALNQASNFTVTLDNTQLNSNPSNSNATKTVEGNSEESTNSFTKPEFDNTKNVEESNVSAESKDGSNSSVHEEATNEVKNENPDNIEGTDGTDGTYEKSDSSNTENTEEVQYDSTDTSDPSVPVEDKENRIDLDTLPEIRTEGSNSEEVAED